MERPVWCGWDCSAENVSEAGSWAVSGLWWFPGWPVRQVEPQDMGPSTRAEVPLSTHLTRQTRARYARTGEPGAFRVNLPDGFPSGYPPVWWWGSDSFTALSPSAGLSAVTRATALVVNTLSALPWRLMSGAPNSAAPQTELPTPRWLSDPMLQRPDDRFPGGAAPAALRQPASIFWAGWVRAALWHGNGYLLFEEDSGGQPTPGTLRTLNPDLVTARTDDGYVGRRIGSSTSGYVDTDRDGYLIIGGRVYRLLELVNPHAPTDEYGQTPGVLRTHAAELAMAARAVAYGSGMFRAGVPAGYLRTTVPNFKKEQADQLKAQWLAAHGGDQRSIAVLNATTEFVPIQMSPVDMALIQMRQMSLVDIANMFSVPAWFLNYDGASSNTYSNNEGRGSDLRQALLPWAVGIEQTLSALLPAGLWVEVDFRAMMRPDTATRYTAYSTAIRDGWLLPDEVRALENLPPLPPQQPSPAPPAEIEGASL